MVYERMARKIVESGSKVHLNTPVHRVIVEGGKAVGIELQNCERRDFDHVISTMPMSLLVERIANVPTNVMEALRKLRYRNTIITYLRIPTKNLFEDNWLYVHSEDLQTGRITNFRNWTPHLYGQSEESILAMEYWCYNEDALWKMSNEELISLATDEILRSRLVSKNQVITGGHVERIERSYPVYARGYREPLEIVENFLSAVKNLSIIGRYGAFKYNNQDHSILMGILAAENISSKRTIHDLWKINTDDEYQEASFVNEAGLVGKS